MFYLLVLCCFCIFRKSKTIFLKVIFYKNLESGSKDRKFYEEKCHTKYILREKTMFERKLFHFYLISAWQAFSTLHCKQNVSFSLSFFVFTQKSIISILNSISSSSFTIIHINFLSKVSSYSVIELFLIFLLILDWLYSLHRTLKH